MSQVESVSESVSEQTETETNTVEFVTLKDHNNHEILNQYPFTIRRKDNHYVVKEHIDSTTGYPRVWLETRNYDKHRLIAMQFIPNPDNLEQVDHISRDRTDYHIENLRWVSRSLNSRNKSAAVNVTYEFVKDISDDSIKVLDYGNHRFEDGDYYYHNDKFFFFNGIDYRILHVNENKQGLKFVCMKSIAGKTIQVYYSKFKQLYNLI